MAHGGLVLQRPIAIAFHRPASPSFWPPPSPAPGALSRPYFPRYLQAFLTFFPTHPPALGHVAGENKHRTAVSTPSGHLPVLLGKALSGYGLYGAVWVRCLQCLYIRYIWSVLFCLLLTVSSYPVYSLLWMREGTADTGYYWLLATRLATRTPPCLCGQGR